MKIFRRTTKAVGLAFFVFVALGFVGSMSAQAATTPALGTAASFSVIGQTSITDVTPSVISGDVGINGSGAGITGLGTAEVAGIIYATDLAYPSEALLPASVQADLSAAYTTDIPGQGSDGSIGPVLDGLVLTPGVYDIGAGRLNGGVLTLNGPGVYIFRASSDFISSGSINLTNGALACDVYWRVQTLATINGSVFTGTILAGTGVHFGANVTLNGRALAVGGDVTLIQDTISGPTCGSVVPALPDTGSSSNNGTVNVVKVVVNDGGGTKTVADFPLFVNGTLVGSGQTNNFPAPAGQYSVTETSDPNYIRTFSGDCDVNGNFNLNKGNNVFCIVTNNDISAPLVPPVPPLIDVVKVPSPLALPDGPGIVNYTYTLRNIGTVPVTDITMVGDTCSPIVLASGDTNNDGKLDVNETWVHTCSTTLTETHTNTVVATGWANGISAVDIANATVVVGLPIIPPLIHVTKVPSPLALSAGGGVVTYTNKVTNPGVVALRNISLNDDKCGTANYFSGDTNGDSRLDNTETWTFTCSQNLTKTTANTVVATGEANGITVRDFAIATVVVAVPRLPNTGVVPTSNIVYLLAGIFTLISASVLVVIKKFRM